MLPVSHPTMGEVGLRRSLADQLGLLAHQEFDVFGGAPRPTRCAVCPGGASQCPLSIVATVSAHRPLSTFIVSSPWAAITPMATVR
ncbi:MAG TPA: hypothetical protein H9881_00835 [Candidatus Stackebrandtia excrementipullorum]|nr:hypothetical protein [Candidatus Stackebrandtia excrementipullorum]